MDFKKMFDLWWQAVRYPKKTFKKYAKKGDLKEGALHILIGGIIAGIAGSLISILSLGVPFVFPLFGSIVSLFINWYIVGGLIYLSAKLLGGNAVFKNQLFLMALYMAPLAIFSSIFFATGLDAIAGIYGLYLLTLVIKQVHGFTTGKAVLSWLIPILVIIFIAILIASFIGVDMLGAGFNGADYGIYSSF